MAMVTEIFRCIFQLKNSGYKLQADIYDLRRNLRRHLYNQILASEEHLLWYGDDDDENPVQAGNYIYHYTFTLQMETNIILKREL